MYIRLSRQRGTLLAMCSRPVQLVLCLCPLRAGTPRSSESNLAPLLRQGISSGVTRCALTTTRNTWIYAYVYAPVPYRYAGVCRLGFREWRLPETGLPRITDTGSSVFREYNLLGSSVNRGNPPSSSLGASSSRPGTFPSEDGLVFLGWLKNHPFDGLNHSFGGWCLQGWGAIISV